MKSLAIQRRGRGEPLRRRRKMKTRRRWTWRSLLHAPIPQIAVLALVLVGLYVLATSRLFSINTVQVLGDTNLPSDRIRLDCRCVGNNIFLTRPEDVRAHLLARMPWLDVRQVYARLPNRVVVDATYRQPALLWRTSVATYTVDQSSHILYNVQAPPVPASMVPTSATVPLVYSPTDTTFRSGQSVATIAVAMVMQTRADLPRDIAPSVNLYRWSPYSGLTAHSKIGWWFSVGINLGGDLQHRIDALENAKKMGYMDQHHCNYVDLRPATLPYCNYQFQWHGPLGPGSR